MLYSKFVKPVTLPPGRARLWTKPAPTGSATFENTIGMVRVACSSGHIGTLPTDMITSGANATSSSAYLRSRDRRRPNDSRFASFGQQSSQLLQTLLKHSVACVRLLVVRSENVEHANAPHLLALL